MLRCRSSSLPGAALRGGLGLLLTVAAACATAEAAPPEQGSATVAQAKEAPMMVIRVVLKVKPEQEAAFTGFVADESAAVRKLDGCVRYELFKATGAEHTYLLYEEWAGQEAFDAFKAGPMLKKSFEVLGPMMDGPPDSAYFAAKKVS